MKLNKTQLTTSVIISAMLIGGTGLSVFAMNSKPAVSAAAASEVSTEAVTMQASTRAASKTATDADTNEGATESATDADAGHEDGDNESQDVVSASENGKNGQDAENEDDDQNGKEDANDANDANENDEKDSAALKSQAKITEADAVAAAEKANAGYTFKADELSDENGTLAYEMKGTDSNGKKLTVLVNAADGTVMPEQPDTLEKE